MDVLQAMRVFARVIDSGSFTAAAQTLELSTAQVSRLVSELEASLQARLLYRTTRRLRLTEAGARYLERCRQILAQVDEAAAEASGAHLTPRGRLRVHSFTGLGTQYLMPLVVRYAELYPQVDVDLALSQRTPDLLEEGHDVVVTHCRELPDSELVAQRLGEVFSVVCAAPAYLRRHGTPQTPEALRAHRCLRLLDPVYPGDWVFERQGEIQVISPGQTFQVNVSEAMVQAAVAGMGGVCCPASWPPRRCARAAWCACCRSGSCTSAACTRCIPRGASSTPRSPPGWRCSRPSCRCCWRATAPISTTPPTGPERPARDCAV